VELARRLIDECIARPDDRPPGGGPPGGGYGGPPGGGYGAPPAYGGGYGGGHGGGAASGTTSTAATDPRLNDPRLNDPRLAMAREQGRADTRMAPPPLPTPAAIDASADIMDIVEVRGAVASGDRRSSGGSDDNRQRRSSELCRFYREGKCRRGDQCLFSHAEPQSRDSRDSSRDSHYPPRRARSPSISPPRGRAEYRDRRRSPSVSPRRGDREPGFRYEPPPRRDYGDRTHRDYGERERRDYGERWDGGRSAESKPEWRAKPRPSWIEEDARQRALKRHPKSR